MNTNLRHTSLFNVLDAKGQVVFQGTISGCSHWVDCHARGKVSVERVRRGLRKKEVQHGY